MNNFCERLKELRMEHNLSYEQLGKHLQVSHTTVSRWEKGEISPTLNYIYALCTYFKVSSDYLLGLEDEFGNKLY